MNPSRAGGGTVRVIKLAKHGNELRGARTLRWEKRDRQCGYTRLYRYRDGFEDGKQTGFACLKK